ncbi:target of rapamycin complex 2 subunit MAPKAP1 [Exaiptasia diaphana]|uniref:Target of rapamycin complex 2 subunit MAPKAP1 n=1 Tax=Exaiptasia diaphana TaxID=2652724 RepID=A0A913X2S3_EXADI|nr:target of rapamycin complex 2 subunit MAPKAP1 [Exaiptasia diaphana]
MAFLDDEDFLISHIRHSCVTSDDTGMCEMVIVNEEAENDKIKQRRKLLGRKLQSDSGSIEMDMADIPSVPPSFDIDVSPLSMRNPKPGGKPGKSLIDRHEMKTRNILWKDPQEPLPSSEIESLFKKRTLNNKAQATSSSQLSNLLKQTLRKPNNPYLDYARFDGEAYQRTCPTKKLRIFLTMVDEDDKCFPMFVTVLGSATVHELTGLIMYKYTAENLEPPLHGQPDRYCLQIAEDDGVVDTDFPALDKDESITKFGFTCLALVEIGPKAAPPKQAVAASPPSAGAIVKVYEPLRGYAQVKVDSTKVKMKVVFDKMLKKRNLRRTGHEYVLEKASEPGVSLDLEAPLASMGTLEFVLTRGDRTKPNPAEKDVKFDFTSFQYKSYRVHMLHKLRTVTEVQLGISKEILEIVPVSAPKTTKLWLVKQRPVSYDMDYIVDCEMTDSRNTGRIAFRISYFSQNSHEYKHHDFEADSQMTDEIVKKVNHIFRSTVSEKRREFQASKEKKAEKRKSIR